MLNDTSFLKKEKAVKDGDVESNPGPADGTPKGRKVKKKQFNFTPKKLDLQNVELNVNVVNSVTI